MVQLRHVPPPHWGPSSIYINCEQEAMQGMLNLSSLQCITKILNAEEGLHTVNGKMLRLTG